MYLEEAVKLVPIWPADKRNPRKDKAGVPDYRKSILDIAPHTSRASQSDELRREKGLTDIIKPPMRNLLVLHPKAPQHCSAFAFPLHIYPDGSF